MNDAQARSVLVGSRLNTMTELNANAMIADGGFKTLVSTGEPIEINPKYARSYTYMARIRARELRTVVARTGRRIEQLADCAKK